MIFRKNRGARRVKGFVRWCLLTAVVLGTAGLVISMPITAMAMQNAGSSLPLTNLLARLEGGPLLLAPAEHFEARTAQNDAIKAAGQALGVQAAPSHVWKMVVTDTEYIGELLKKRSCYVVEYVTILNQTQEKTLEEPAGVYVVIDAQSGQCWEIFTPPETAWWKRVSYRGLEVVQEFAKSGEKGMAAKNAPQISLRTALQGLLKAKPGGASAIADQIIARYFLYTTAEEGRQIKRVNGTEIVPLYAQRPVWYISLEGSQLPMVEPSGGSGAGQPKLEEMNMLVDARTGKGLRSETSR